MKSKSINFKATHPLELGSRLEEGVADGVKATTIFLCSSLYPHTRYPHTSLLWPSKLAPKEIN